MELVRASSYKQMKDKRTIGLMLGCGTASNLWKSSLSSGPMLIYAPLFSVLSQYLGAEKTVTVISQASLVHTKESALTSDTSSIVFNFIALHTNFMTSNDSLEAILFTEPLGDVWTKLHTNTSFARSSAR